MDPRRGSADGLQCVGKKTTRQMQRSRCSLVRRGHRLIAVGQQGDISHLDVVLHEEAVVIGGDYRRGGRRGADLWRNA